MYFSILNPLKFLTDFINIRMRYFLLFCIATIVNSVVYSQNHAIQLNIKPTKFRKDTFNIARYGAVAKDDQLVTEFINKAITDCNNKGGGVVFIPSGIWNTGPIVMKSNVNLHLAKGAALVF